MVPTKTTKSRCSKGRDHNFSEQRQNRIDEMKNGCYPCHAESKDPTSLNTGEFSIFKPLANRILGSSSLSDVHRTS